MAITYLSLLAKISQNCHSPKLEVDLVSHVEDHNHRDDHSASSFAASSTIDFHSVIRIVVVFQTYLHSWVTYLV